MEIHVGSRLSLAPTDTIRPMADIPDISGIQDMWRALQRGQGEEQPGWAHPSLRPSSNRRPTVHQLKVTLSGVKPPVWRRVLIPSTRRLDEVAGYLLAAMGWANSHLHCFYIGDRRYDMIHPYSEGTELDEGLFTLREVFDAVGSKMRFEYDFGDGWEHQVLLEEVRIAKKAESEPSCIAGRRACPPEDCGGPHGYMELMEILEYGPETDWERQRLEWMGEDFDPNEFDVDEATEAMRGAAGYWD